MLECRSSIHIVEPRVGIGNSGTSISFSLRWSCIRRSVSVSPICWLLFMASWGFISIFEAWSGDWLTHSRRRWRDQARWHCIFFRADDELFVVQWHTQAADECSLRVQCEWFRRVTVFDSKLVQASLFSDDVQQISNRSIIAECHCCDAAWSTNSDFCHRC